MQVNFAQECGPVKPMHAVNNGPVYKFAEDQRITNIDSYRAAGIPYARTHDASFYATYGGEHTVDIHAIFPDFDKDPLDPKSYDFVLTDEYLKVIEFSGTKIFYRLGSKIEHWKKKYGTLPPKDFHKWAVICEHIIRHYTEGWADGFHMDIEYWEIWNEPDLDPDDSTHKRCWGGTKLQFFELYHIAATHLKKCFPHLKIGGPAIAGDLQWAEDFLAQLKAPLDFFSWHIYSAYPEKVVDRAVKVRALLDKYGFENTESILNEWNYVRGWTGDDWYYTLCMEKSLKGAAFIAGTMLSCQAAPVDMLMFYDARPGAMNSLYCTDRVCECLKGYYPFRMFNELYKLGSSAAVETPENIYAAAARSNGRACVMVAHYSDDDSTGEKHVRIEMSGLSSEKEIRFRYYLLDADHDMALVKEEYLEGGSVSTFLTLPNLSTVLIEMDEV